MNQIIKWFYKLTNGRPMYDKGINFIDKVSGESVRNFEDYFGRRWMANNRWSIFRVSRDSEYGRNNI